MDKRIDNKVDHNKDNIKKDNIKKNNIKKGYKNKEYKNKEHNNKGDKKTDDYNNLKWIRRGSYTVEASLVMGFVFLIIAIILYISSFLYGRACLTASAYEQAFTGREQEPYGLFGFGEIEKMCSFLENQHTVSYRGTCYSAWGELRSDVEVEAVVKIEKPVTFLRRWKKLQQFKE